MKSLKLNLFAASLLSVSFVTVAQAKVDCLFGAGCVVRGDVGKTVKTYVNPYVTPMLQEGVVKGAGAIGGAYGGEVGKAVGYHVGGVINERFAGESKFARPAGPAVQPQYQQEPQLQPRPYPQQVEQEWEDEELSQPLHRPSNYGYRRAAEFVRPAPQYIPMGNRCFTPNFPPVFLMQPQPVNTGCGVHTRWGWIPGVAG